MASFGENLKRERELRGIDLREIAQATKISVRFLEALEADRIDLLPGGIFRRSFVREYARYVGLDADRMVSEFLHAFGEERAAEPLASPEAKPRRSYPLYRRIFFGLVVLLVCGVAVRLAGSREPKAQAAALPSPAIVFPHDQLLPQHFTAEDTGSSPAGTLVLTIRAE